MQNPNTKPYKLVANQASWISFEEKTYPVANGVVWLTDVEARPLLQSEAILPAEAAAQPGLNLKVK